jgi:hypothetical protein
MAAMKPPIGKRSPAQLRTVYIFGTVGMELADGWTIEVERR